MWKSKCCQLSLNNRKALQGNGFDSCFQPVNWKRSVRAHLLDMLIPSGCGIPAKTQAERLVYMKIKPLPAHALVLHVQLLDGISGLFQSILQANLSLVCKRLKEVLPQEHLLHKLAARKHAVALFSVPRGVMHSQNPVSTRVWRYLSSCSTLLTFALA